MTIPVSNCRHFVITTLAEYQSAFWAGVARLLIDRGDAVSFISFDDNSTSTLRAEGFHVYALTPSEWAHATPASEINARLAAFGIDDTPYWYAHEKWNFQQWDDTALDQRLYLYLGLCEAALADLVRKGSTPVLVQELGGFLSVIAAYHAARRVGVDNWFVEPSFFKGRCFWLKNTFAARSDFEVAADRIEGEAVAYLNEARSHQTIVIPIKDRHQYATPARKILNMRNLRRLIEKALDKYLHGKRQEFNHLGAVVRRHLGTLSAAWRLQKVYTPLGKVGRFVYYPLHVPGDMALTLRSPSCLDQLSLIETIARQLPRDVRLAIKEHPAMIGALGAEAILGVLRRNQNVVMIDPAQNNYDVMSICEAVVSVNSKSGAEALLLDKPVFVLGDAFYRGWGLTTDLDAPGELKPLLRQALACPAGVDETRRAAFFSAVWRESHLGELYVAEPENLDTFVRSLLTATGGPQ